MQPEGSQYSPALAELLSAPVEYPLVPTKPVADWGEALAELDDVALFGSAKIADCQMAQACRAGLWLRFDFMDRSHAISQEIRTPTGSFWHGVLHRREPDWANAKYWFDRVGEHAIFADLAGEAANIASSFALDAKSPWLAESGDWDPLRFVDLCQSAHRAGGELAELCRRVQVAEWRLLFDYCYRHAVAQ